MPNTYEPMFMAEAYDLLVKSLKDQLREACEEVDKEAYKQVTTWDVIFPFVLEHCGRDKLLELGKLIGEAVEKEHGVDEGIEEVVAGYAN